MKFSLIHFKVPMAFSLNRAESDKSLEHELGLLETMFSVRCVCGTVTESLFLTQGVVESSPAIF